MQQDVTNLAADGLALHLLSDAMLRRLRQDGRTPKIDPDTDLIETGLIDSQALLDVILDVEANSGRLFDAEGMDFERGVTLRRLAAAFATAA